MTTFPTAEQVKLTDVIAPSFYEVHRDIAAGGHTYYKLDGGRGSAKSSFVGTEIILDMMRDAQAGKITNAVAFRRYKGSCMTAFLSSCYGRSTSWAWLTCGRKR